MTKIRIAVEIQIGDKTHHQDHVIIPNSFKVIKISVSRPQNPMPPDAEFDELDICISLYF